MTASGSEIGTTIGRTFAVDAGVVWRPSRAKHIQMRLTADPGRGAIGGVGRVALATVDVVGIGAGRKNVVVVQRVCIEVALKRLAHGDRVRRAVSHILHSESRVMAEESAALVASAIAKDALISHVVGWRPEQRIRGVTSDLRYS